MQRGLHKVWTRTRGLVRHARQIRSFLAETITAEQAASRIAEGVREREARFLGKLTRSVYGHERSPYRRLLHFAGCEFGDVEKLVAQDGLEGALTALAKAGVTLTFEEFKCRTPAVRGSRTFRFEPDDFDDPCFVADSRSSSGGTSGRPMRFGWSFALEEQWAPHWCVFFAANDCLGKPLIFWTPGNSGATGPQVSLAKCNQRFDRWFVAQDMTRPTDRTYAFFRQWIGRQFAGFPKAQRIPYNDAGPVLDCVRGILDEFGTVSLNTAPSAAVRLSLEAQARGVDITGLNCLLGAEPLTETRRETIEASGARTIPLYGSTEAVWTGGQCPNRQHGDEVHLLGDLHAVINGVGDADSEPPPLLFTSLAPLTPKILINTDIGDRGHVGRRRCDCLYDETGCRQVIHTIRSSDKLTEFGVTFWVADVYQVLEDALPRRLGATIGDFQLIETSTAAGLPQYVLLAHPRLNKIDEAALPKLFFTELNRFKPYYGFMTAIWEREKVLDVARRPPLATNRGKILPFLRLPSLPPADPADP